MNTAVETTGLSQQAAEHIDVLIVGAGISGIDAAYHISKFMPGRSFAMLENQTGIGGTWRTHTYPGIRSDSDLYTFGYKWKPWVDEPIAAADKILRYLDDALDENDLRRHIRFQHQVKTASWSSEDALWTVEVEHLGTGETLHFTTNFLWMCQGYYNHDEPYTPEWPGMDQYKGRIVHPQHWPEDLDYSDMNVLVIGSGATAATLVPAMAGKCKHITMLQRSPTYFLPNPNANEMADTLRQLEVPDEWIHEIVRRKILWDQEEITRRCETEPEVVKEELLAAAREFLGPDYPVEKHFNPSYRPWQQRLAFIPDGDLFVGIAQGLATVVTDEIDTFTEKGLRTTSGEELEADLIITATGFDLLVLGGIEFSVDGEAVDFSERVAWRGMMFNDVPNMAWVFGYFRASWTLRCDLMGELFTRMFEHMDSIGAKVVTPTLRPEDSNMELKAWTEEDNFNPGYLARSMHLMPKQGTNDPWVNTQDYWIDKDALPVADLNDGSLKYS